MKFLMMIVSFAVSAFGNIVTVFIKTKMGKTSEWKRLLSGTLPMIFAYLEKPIVNGVKDKLAGSEKFQEALNMAEKYLSRYVDTKVAKDDLMAYIQHEFLRWESSIAQGKSVVTEVIVDGRALTIDEVI